jgi:hypothetical protein
MKDAVLTVRLPSRLRRRIEDLASQEGRSLSQQVGRLIEQGIGAHAEPAVTGRRRQHRALSGLFQGGRVPTLAEFREARALIAASLRRRGGTHAPVRR